MTIEQIFVIASFVLALAGFILTFIFRENNKRRKLFAILTVIFLLIGIMSVGIFGLAKSTEIIITAPKNNATVVSERGPNEQFTITVSGKISGRLPDKTRNKIYALVCPKESQVCWTQFPETIPDTSWSTIARLGGTEQNQAREGEKFDLIAVISEKSLDKEYPSIQQLPGVTAISSPITVTATYKNQQNSVNFNK